jgi:hypothetical protein
VHLGPFWAAEARVREKLGANGTCQPGRFYVLSDLPIKRLTRATREGQSALAAEQGSFAAQLNPLSDTRGGNSHRKGITRGKHLPHRIDTETLGERLRSFCVGVGKAAVGPFFRGSWQIARS